MLGERLAEYFNANPKVELMTSSVEQDSCNPGIAYQRADLSRKEELKKVILDFFPDFIINAAAYTNVNRSETERELAWKINVKGIENISQYARAVDAHIIHISSDYIFDGKNGPYTEADRPNPVSYYGRTKLAGENALSISGTSSTIIRTNVLYGPAKHSRPDFVKWAVDSLRSGKTIRIVTDQLNNPTYLDDLVTAINSIILMRKQGIYNIGGAEFLSRYDFTLRIADFFQLDRNLIVPILTAELNQQAKRPMKSGLITLKAQIELNFNPSPIGETFRKMKKELNIL